LNNIENIVCTKNPTKVVKICVIFVLQLEYGADESYKLVVPSPEKPSYAQLEVSWYHWTPNPSFCHFL